MEYVKEREDCIQSIFQANNDFSHDPDHIHNFSNLITTPKRDEIIYTTSYSIASMLGKITCFWFTHTKSNEELEPIIEGVKNSSDILGKEALKRFET